jgi:hypothetical protein
MIPVPDENGTLAKGQFAQHIGVSPGRVSQYVRESKISGAALTGDGRIHVETAKAQLRVRLDSGQMAGNGLTTKLSPSPQAPLVPNAPPDNIEEQIKRERLAEFRSRNRKLAEEEAARAGRYADAESMKQQFGQIAGEMIGLFEGMLAKFAAAIAVQFKVPERDALHLLRSTWRDERVRAASESRLAADAMPVFVEDFEGENATEESATPTGES